MKTTLLMIFFALTMLTNDFPRMSVQSVQTLDSLGAAQGVSWINGRLYAYGDREVGVIRAYGSDDSLSYLGKEWKLTIDGKDLINHPTGIAWNGEGPTFIGNTIRLNKEGTQWKAVIHVVDWEGLLRTGTLDGNLLGTIEDDICIQGTRPEYVRYKNRWAVATADYGGQHNEVRLYDPAALASARKTSEGGVLIAKFDCSPWVQTLKWIEEKGILVLVQNQIEGRRWRFSFLDMEASIRAGKEVVLRKIDIDRADELEGFTLSGDIRKGVAVSSSRRNNAAIIELQWQ